MIFQHDIHFITQPRHLGWSFYPNERFFIRKFGMSDITGRELRLEETHIFQQSISSESPDIHLHVRDYHRLCRGEKLVNMCKMIINNQSVQNYLKETFQNFIEKKTIEGFCELRKNDDPWLLLAPVKVITYFGVEYF